MTEVALDTDAGKRRRLPAWMLPKNPADDEVGTSGIGARVSSSVEEQPENQDTESKVRTMPRKRSRALLKQDKEGSSCLDVVQKGNAKKRSIKGRNANRDSLLVNPENEIIQENENECGEVTKDEKPAGRKRPQRKGMAKKSKTMPLPGGSEDEIELTVEDLVCIAKQYVNSVTEKKQHGSSAVRTSESESLTSDLLPFSKSNTAGPCQSIGTGKMLGKCTMKMSSYNKSAGLERNEIESHETEDNLKNITRTGDAAQDMLDLLLGPLLKKLPVKEPEPLLISEHITGGILQVRRENYSEEAAITKKKSSLKNKVAVLLD